MDSITHIAIGACMGEAFAGKRLGRKAMIWGAVAQSLPDIDFVASFWMDTPSDLLAHRGFTHSFLFLVLIVPLMALSAEKWHRPHNISFKKWLAFFAAAVFVHLFLDVFNNYGIGWLEPFSHKRFSLNAVYVADPFFSLWPGLATIALIVHRKKDKLRTFYWRFGLGMAAIYLGLCVVNKIRIDRQVNTAFQLQNIPHQLYFTTPAPLQNWLWFVVSGDEKGFYTGFRSLLDGDKKIQFEFVPRNQQMIDSLKDHEEVLKLIRFSQGFYTVEKWKDTLVFNDLRFGQIIGWADPCNRFVFHYYLSHPNENKMVVQRGRFDKWDLNIAFALLRRMRGED